jgi:bacteriochlorophyllide a dehydrogenase
VTPSPEASAVPERKEILTINSVIHTLQTTGTFSVHPADFAMQTRAVVLDQPRRLALRRLPLDAAGDGDVRVRVGWTGISTGTERLLWAGQMPAFPGLGYPLVPGYEAVGQVVEAGERSGRQVGDWVFVPGARCFGETRGLFGGAASTLVVPGDRATPIAAQLAEGGTLMALAATAYHAAWGSGGAPPELIVGHGALGRLLARLTVAMGSPPPTVWEHDPERRDGTETYPVIDPGDDPRRDYRAVYDMSGDAGLLDELIGRCARGGEVVLAGFYHAPLTFAFVPAFLREVRLRVAAEWKPGDLAAVAALANEGRLPLQGLITHTAPAPAAVAAYHTAFTDPSCVKMILDWRDCA